MNQEEIKNIKKAIIEIAAVIEQGHGMAYLKERITKILFPEIP